MICCQKCKAITALPLQLSASAECHPARSTTAGGGGTTGGTEELVPALKEITNEVHKTCAHGFNETISMVRR